MSNIHFHGTAGAIAHPEASLAGRARALFTKLASWRKLTLAERELASLDDRMLEDIGVPRSEIHQRVWGERV